MSQCGIHISIKRGISQFRRAHHYSDCYRSRPDAGHWFILFNRERIARRNATECPNNGAETDTDLRCPKRSASTREKFRDKRELNQSLEWNMGPQWRFNVFNGQNNSSVQWQAWTPDGPMAIRRAVSRWPRRSKPNATNEEGRGTIYLHDPFPAVMASFKLEGEVAKLTCLFLKAAESFCCPPNARAYRHAASLARACKSGAAIPNGGASNNSSAGPSIRHAEPFKSSTAPFLSAIISGGVPAFAMKKPPITNRSPAGVDDFAKIQAFRSHRWLVSSAQAR